MTLLQTFIFASVLGSGAASSAADMPKNLAADNIWRCQTGSGCYNKVLFGRTYEVLPTRRLIVMVSLSREGEYTRADISIANNTGLPLNLSPNDFRIEVISPKPKVLSYLAPANLKDVPPSPPIPAVEPQSPQPPAATGAPLNIDELYAAAKKHQAEQEAADKAAALQHLASATVAADQTVRGRVYFERDKHAQQINVILPIAGQVFEFPYPEAP